MTTSNNKYFGMSAMPYEKKVDIITNEYNPSVHRIGVTMAAIHMIIMFFPGLALLLFFNVFPGWGNIMAAAIPIWTMMAPIYIMEPIQYFLALGTMGTYVGFLAGNNSNIRLPVAIATEDAMGVEPGTPEGEIIGGLGIIASQWVLVVVTLVAALLVTAVIGILPPVIVHAFDYLLPALFGGMLVQIGMSHWRFALLSAALAVVLFFIGVPLVFITLIMVIVMVVVGIVFYNNNIWTPKPVVEMPD